MQVTIQNANQVWSSPDGQRRIYEVTYTDPSGSLVTAKTYSDKIGQGKGQSFDLEAYSKQGRNGAETFVKQVETNNSGYGQSAQGGGQSSSPANNERQFKADPAKQGSIERQSALKSAVEVVGVHDVELSSVDAAHVAVQIANEFVSFISGTPAEISAAMPGAQVVDDNQPPAESYEPPVQDSMV